MSEQHSPVVVEDLLQEATRRLVRAVDGLDDNAYAEPSGLPGWTRGHVLAHLTLNAEGLAAALSGIVDRERESPAEAPFQTEARLPGKRALRGRQRASRRRLGWQGCPQAHLGGTISWMCTHSFLFCWVRIVSF